MKHIQERFAITISPVLEIHYIHLHNHKHLLAKPKRFTLLAESWGTMRFAWIALNILPPDVFVDTTGCTFTFLVAKLLAGCKVACYVHYPTISTVSQIVLMICILFADVPIAFVSVHKRLTFTVSLFLRICCH